MESSARSAGRTWESSITRLHPDRRGDQPGNSGGALVNLKGELIGINTAIFTRAAATWDRLRHSSNMAKSVMESLIKHGKVGGLARRVDPDLNGDLAKEFGAPDTKGHWSPR